MGGCKEKMEPVLDELKTFWKTYFVLLTPLLLLPLPLAVPGTESACGYVVLIMAVFWVSEALPIAVTALLPMILFPLMGVLPAGRVAPNYMRDTNFVFMGGLMMALAVEKSNLHTRIALKVLSMMGTKPRWLMLGFMLPTWFLSMWISNTATTAMMVPVAAAVLQQFKISMLIQEQAKTARNNPALSGSVFAHVNGGLVADEEAVVVEVTSFGADVSDTKQPGAGEKAASDEIDADADQDEDVEEERIPSSDDAFSTTEAAAKYTVICKMLSLCVCYSANIGGTATLTGTTPNLVLAGNVEAIWREQGLPAPITWASWLPWGLPTATICLGVCWLWMVTYFLGIREFCCCCGSQEHDPENEKRVQGVVEKEYKSLGPMRYDEITSLSLFVILVLLWFTRDPGFVQGYSVLFEDGYVSDSVPAMFMALWLFILPEAWPKSRVFCGVRNGESATSVPALLSWKLVSEKMPWGPIFVVGGGYAMAEAVEESGLSVVIADALEVFGDLVPWLMIFIITIIVAVLTNITSNTATTTLILPILAALADAIEVNPLYLMLPATVSTSMAFLLPVATPPNAIVFATGYLQVKDMFLAGLMLNLLCIVVILIGTHTWGMALFDLDTIPWDTNSTLIS